MTSLQEIHNWTHVVDPDVTAKSDIAAGVGVADVVKFEAELIAYKEYVSLFNFISYEYVALADRPVSV